MGHHYSFSLGVFLVALRLLRLLWDPSSSLQFYVTSFCLKFLHCSTSLCGNVIYFSCFNYMHTTIKYLAQIVLSRLQIHRFPLGSLSSALNAHSLQGSCFTSQTCLLSLVHYLREWHHHVSGMSHQPRTT